MQIAVQDPGSDSHVHDRTEPKGLGLRAQIALSLVAVLALAGLLATLAIGPLVTQGARQLRHRAGLTLARAVAGQAASMSTPEATRELLADAVGPGALSAAAVISSDGSVTARAGTMNTALPRPPFVERTRVVADVLVVHVAFPTGAAFVGEVQLAPERIERALPVAVLLYSSAAAFAALFVVFVLLTRYTVRPIEALTRAAERVASGRRDVFAPLAGAREVARAALAFNDMTRQLASRERERTTRIEELERLTSELRKARDSLVRSERLAVVGRLAAGIAHEVGNPLAAIVGLTDVLAEGGLDDSEVRDFSGRIGREAQRIHRTIRELLDYARAAPEDAPSPSQAPRESGDVGEAIAQVRRLLEPQKAMRNIDVEASFDADAQTCSLSTDRLVQVLLNIVLNAAHAIGLADNEVCEAAGTITIRATRADSDVLIAVEDDGPGIPAEARVRIFEPFYTTKPAGEGTGLGLAICAVIVEGVNGSIRAADRTDGAKGARIEVRIPRVA